VLLGSFKNSNRVSGNITSRSSGARYARPLNSSVILFMNLFHRNFIFVLSIFIFSCASEKPVCVSCDYRLSDLEKIDLKNRIDSGDKKAAREYLDKLSGPYHHKVDFPYYLKAYSLVGLEKDAHNIVFMASHVDDIYACKDAIDFLRMPSVKEKLDNKDAAKALWCYKQWSDPEFERNAMKNRSELEK